MPGPAIDYVNQPGVLPGQQPDAYQVTGSNSTGIMTGIGLGNPNASNDESDLFANAIAQERARRAKLAGQMDASGAVTDKSIATLQGETPSNTLAATASTGTYAPSATEGVDLSGVGGFKPTATEGVSLSPLSGVDLSGLQKFQSGALNADNPDAALNTFGATAGGAKSALSGFTAQGFDAQSAVDAYAKGATSDFFQNQKLALADLGAKSVGAGRFNSGLFDKDQGSVITELGRGFTSDIAKTSVEAAGITAGSIANQNVTNERAGEAVDANRTAEGQLQLSALQSAAQQRFNKASAIDSNTLDASKAYGTDAISLGTNLVDASLKQAGTIDSSLQTAQEDAAKYGLAKAGTIDQATLDAAKATDSFNLNRAESADTFNLDRDKAATTDSQARTDQLQTGEEDSSNRYLAALTGAIASYQAKQNADKQSSSDFWTGLLKTAGTVAAAAV